MTITDSRISIDQIKDFFPTTKDDFYDECLKLLPYFNSKLLREKDFIPYKNGNRYSIAYTQLGDKLCRPILFGTGGRLNDNLNFKELFLNPQNYNYKYFDHTWEERFYPIFPNLVDKFINLTKEEN